MIDAGRWREAIGTGARAAAGLTLAVPSRPSGTIGAALGAGRGSSVEFMEHREYQPGDDLRRIDWGVYARSDRLAVRTHREEVSPYLDIVIDASASMDLPGSGKAEAVISVCAALLDAARRSGFTPALYRCAERCEPVPLEGGALLPGAWRGFTAEETDARAIRDACSRLRRGGVRVLLSDMLWRDEPAPLLSAFARDAARALVLHTLAPDDLEPPPPGTYRLRDRETQRRIDVEIDAAAAARFRARADAFVGACRDACRRCAAELIPVAPDAKWTDELLRRQVLIAS